MSFIRYTNVLHQLRLDNDHEVVAIVEAAKARFPPCVTHGEIADPIVVLNQHDDLIFACPFCAGSAVLARWRAEVPTMGRF